MDCRIVENGPVFSSITTHYYGWKVDTTYSDVASRTTIHAGTRLTHLLLTTTVSIDSLCTGIVKDKETIRISHQGDKSHFGYVATYGKQSLNNDRLGLAVFFRVEDYRFAAEDANSNIVVLNSTNKNIEYYFMAAWEGEPMGISNEDQFKNYLQHVSQCLASPVNVLVGSPSSNRRKRNGE